jgi:predicted dehydrogenase
MHRRRFLSAASATAIFSAVPVIRAREGAKKYRTALIGSGWWGMNILREALASGQVNCVALCDADANKLEHASEEVKELSGTAPKQYRDFRELLEQEKPDIVIIATPDHWHALQTIAALQAGAHVFVEKPTAHTVNESRAMVKAARETGKVVQVGLHRRIGPHHVNAMNFLRSGKVGRVGMVRCFVYSGGGRELPKPNATPPEGLDWDLYCGPAPRRPFNSKIHPGGWREFLDFANGQIGDWGVHWLDQVMWWTEEKGPRRIFSSGGRARSGPAVLNDKEQTTDAPEQQVAVFDFEGFSVTWEHRKFGENGAGKHRVGAYFFGTDGTLHIGWRDGWTFYPANDKAQVIHEDSQVQEPDGHNLTLLWRDFLKAIETKSAPVSNLEAAHRSSVLPLLANLSLKTGRSLTWNPEKEEITGDAEAAKGLSRAYRAPWVYPS